MNKLIKLPSLGFSGRIVSMHTVDSRTGLKHRDWSGFNNHVVDIGLDLLGQNPNQNIRDFCQYMQLGTGTTAPSDGDATLQAPVGTLVARDSDPIAQSTGGETGLYYASIQQDFTFDAGTIDGVPLAEIGIFSQLSGNPMFARTLIKDEMGAPTAITLLNYEILIITYELRLYIEEADVVGTFFLGSDEYNYTLRYKRRSSAWFGGLGDKSPIGTLGIWAAGSDTSLLPRLSNASLSDQQTTSLTMSFNSYSPGSFSIVATPGIVGINSLNVPGGISIFRFQVSTYSTSRYEILVSKVSDGTPIPKDSDHTWTFTDFLQISWGRYVP